jgi:hypothetical protein
MLVREATIPPTKVREAEDKDTEKGNTSEI